MAIPSERTWWGPVAPPPVGLVRPVRLDPEGRDGPTPAQSRHRRWTRTDHGWYVPSGAPRHLPEQRVWERSVRLPEGGAVTGWAAGRLLGAAFMDGRDRSTGAHLPVPLAIGPHRSIAASPGVVALNHVLLAADRTHRQGVPLVVGPRAAYDAVRLAPDLREAVVAVDMMAAAGVCSVAQLREYAARQPQDFARADAALDLASDFALSPPEVDVRLVVELDLGRPRPAVNCFVHDGQGRRVAMVDLLDVEAGLVVEVNGGHHSGPGQAAADLRRTETLQRLGLEVCSIAGSESHRRVLVAQRVRLGLGRSRFEPPGERGWYHVPAQVPWALGGGRPGVRPGA